MTIKNAETLRAVSVAAAKNYYPTKAQEICSRMIVESAEKAREGCFTHTAFISMKSEASGNPDILLYYVGRTLIELGFTYTIAHVPLNEPYAYKVTIDWSN